ncbi:MAG: A/G-specific adenine glycosylase, partial [Planctomycetota bacterium]|nr:A/G-specific adenine glycosylase [Planctomycetota bacterium]
MKAHLAAHLGGRVFSSWRRTLQRTLLAWYRKHQRDLPWRRTGDPYRIWVSEVLLQQTQVATALPYYERFLARFPTVEALAAAPEQAVLKTWQGLGYYRRAMNLRAAARLVVRDHGGRVPDDPTAFAALPGVGRYTCGAVMSIAFGRPLAALDGNASRVIARWLAMTAPVNTSATQAKLWKAAETLLAPSAPGDWNQAVMELGATVCLPRGPRCIRCPVRRHCRAAAKGLQNRIPAKRKRKPIPHIEVGAGIIWRRGRILLCKRKADAMLGGLWEFPGGKRHRGESIQRCIRRELMEECALPVTVGKHLIDVTHTYTHLRVTLRMYHCRAGAGRVKLIGCDDAKWVR